MARTPVRNLGAGTKADAMEKHCFLICFPWLKFSYLILAFYIPGQPAQG